MDLVGPLPTAHGNYKYEVVAVEYFTKWVEAKPSYAGFGYRKLLLRQFKNSFGRTSYAGSGYRRS